MRFVILGPPRTKKNSRRRKYSFAQKRTFSVESEAQEKWAVAAAEQLQIQRNAYLRRGGAGARWEPIRGDVHVRALVYRDADRGDLVGYLQAIGDVLEALTLRHATKRRPPSKGGIIVDDKQIKSWDGSRLLLDRDNPRVEIYVEAFGG